MNAKPRSFSIPDELSQAMNSRVRQESMTISEYLRKCIREEIERAARSSRKNLPLAA